MAMSKEVWLHWRKQLGKRLGAAMKRLSPAKKREVWRAYARVWRRKGGNFHINWIQRNEEEP